LTGVLPPSTFVPDFSRNTIQQATNHQKHEQMDRELLPQSMTDPRNIRRIVAAIILLAVWILIDKGNVYGQTSARTVVDPAKGSEQLMTDNRGGGGKPDEGDGSDEDGGMVVYPNPTRDILVFDFEFTVRGGSTGQCQIVDALGRNVYSGQVSTDGAANRISLGHLRPSLYMARVDLDGRTMVRRFFKE
jgi:hypothetical protein